jgi:hypothetical protein
MRRSSRRRLLPVLALATLLAAVAPAGSTPQVLADFEKVLPLLQPPERSRLLQRADTWRGWTAAERARHAERLAAWEALPAAERGERRERYRAWQALPPAERARIARARRDFERLDESQRQALRARFDSLDGSLRRGWRLGPALGADYPALQPLLAQVPEAGHEPLLRVLRAMAPQQRADLAALVQRTPPQERDALRRELVSTAASNRDAWLWERLQR